MIAVTKSLFFVKQFSAMVVWHHEQNAAPVEVKSATDRYANVTCINNIIDVARGSRNVTHAA